MRRYLLALTAASLLLPLSATAQGFAPVPNSTEYLQFLGGSGVNGTFGVQVGPYTGQFTSQPGTPSFNLYCVDFDHYARSTWVTASSLDGSLSATRLGSTGGNVAAYTQAAYLTSLFDAYEGNTDAWSAIHAAIWTTIRNSLNPADALYEQPVPSGSYALRDDFLAMAETAVADGWTAKGFYVLTPDNDTDGKWNGQEFLVRVDVPEPSTILLMVSGLLLIGILGRRREMSLTA